MPVLCEQPALRAFCWHEKPDGFQGRYLPRVFFSVSGGEPPNKEVLEEAYHAPIRQLAPLLAAGPEESMQIWSFLDQCYYYA